jgi:hypothetical protein
MSDDAATNLTIDALLASAVAEVVPDSACVVYRFKNEAEESSWLAVATAGDVTVLRDSLGLDNGLLAPPVGAAGICHLQRKQPAPRGLRTPAGGPKRCLDRLPAAVSQGTARRGD